MQNSAATPTPVQGKPHNAAVTWAWIGAVYLAVLVYTFYQWISTGSATPVDPGADIPGPAMTTWIITLDIAGPVIAIWAIWNYFLKPRMKTGRTLPDGTLMLFVS